MTLRSFVQTAVVATLACTGFSVQAQPLIDGFLCCNMRTDGSWISDANYNENGKRMIAVGTPTKVTGYGRFRVHIDMNGKKEAIGNDYSRDLDLGAFAARYVVKDDPKQKISKFPQKTQDAIRTMRLHNGMTREQVLMAVGYPMSSENPHLDSNVWRFWLSSFAEYQVVFDERGLVKTVETDAQTRNLVVMP